MSTSDEAVWGELDGKSTVVGFVHQRQFSTPHLRPTTFQSIKVKPFRIALIVLGSLFVLYKTVFFDYFGKQPGPSWHKYVVSPPARRIYAVSVISNTGTPGISNPSALLTPGGKVTTFQRHRAPPLPLWPPGTTVNASSHALPNSHAGKIRTYYPNNTIDGDKQTFWNAAMPGRYPDVLTITLPQGHNMEANGITILSSEDGYIQDFSVDILAAVGSENAAGRLSEIWQPVASIVGNDKLWIPVAFDEYNTTARAVKSVRITVTRAQKTKYGEYTRINEVWPGIIPPPEPAPALVVDFGKVVVGHVSIAFAGSRGFEEGNPGLRLAFSETMQYLSDVSDFSRSYNGDSITPGSDQISVSANPYIWTDTYGCLDPVGKRACSDGLHAFRYMKIYLDALHSDVPLANPHGTVSIDHLYLDFTAYLGTPESFSGWFECSDPTLNQFWYDAAYTNDLCIDTFRVNDTEPRTLNLVGKPVLHDGAKRDRDPYVGDLAVAARTAYLTHGKDVSDAARNVLADLADHQRADGWIPPASIFNYTLHLFDYPLWWITSSYDYLLYTGEFEFLDEYYNTIVQVLDTYYPLCTSPETGLLDKGRGPSRQYGDYAFIQREGEVAYYNALYVLALKNAAEMARWYSRQEDASRWTLRAEDVSRAINVHLWDSSCGAFYDTVPSAEQRATHGQDGNMLSILTGVANSTRASSILRYWDTLALPYGNPFFSNSVINPEYGHRVYAFISYFEISARFSLNDFANSALDEIRRLYGWMAGRDPGHTFWEGIGRDGSMYEEGYTSAAHGWSSGVAPALTEYVLGVAPTGLGFKTWRVRPVLCGEIAWARGKVPVGEEAVSVSWLRESGRWSVEFTMQVRGPRKTTGTASVPVSANGRLVLVNGMIAWDGRKGKRHQARYEPEGYVTLDLYGGATYAITVMSGSKFNCPLIAFLWIRHFLSSFWNLL